MVGMREKIMTKTIQIVQVETAILHADAIQAAEILKIRLREFCDFVHRARNHTTPTVERDYFWMIGNVAFMIDMIEQLTLKIDHEGTKILLDAIPDAHRLTESLRQDMHGNLSLLAQ